MTRRRRLIWLLFRSYLAIILVALSVTAIYTIVSMRAFHRSEVEANLCAMTRVIESQLRASITSNDRDGVTRIASELASAGRLRLTVVEPDGRVVFDSDEHPGAMDLHHDRPEVAEALAGRTGTSVRHSSTVNREMLYVTVPVLDAGGAVVAVVRTSLAMSAVGEATRSMYRSVTTTGAIVAALAAIVALVVSRRISEPLVEMRRVADVFAKGDFGHRMPPTTCEELGGLADSMSAMAAQLDERIRTITEQSDEREAILASLVEGVMAVASDDEVIGMNGAAARILGVDPGWARGKLLQEVVRNTELQRFIRRALTERKRIDDDLDLIQGDRELHVYAAPLKTMGAVIVLHDVTDIRRLERMRKEFVANVSHELRTPLTTIKGFAWTLMEGDLDTETSKRFLGIITEQAERLNALLEDILLLSRLDRKAISREIGFESHFLAETLARAVGTCAPLAEAKGIVVSTQCPEDLRVLANASLLEQAFVNLVDNAIKYSEPGSEVNAAATVADGGVAVAVTDRGCGIAPEHHARVFERFYRVDRARSRKLGGTGLGLSIVKHIAEVHGGRATVESAPGAGSVFSILLPSGSLQESACGTEN